MHFSKRELLELREEILENPESDLPKVWRERLLMLCDDIVEAEEVVDRAMKMVEISSGYVRTCGKSMSQIIRLVRSGAASDQGKIQAVINIAREFAK